MNFKKIGLCIALTSFTLTLFAQPVTYSFSSFGGGLPSSIQVAQSPVQNVDYGPGSIIIEEDTDEYISDEEDVTKFSDEFLMQLIEELKKKILW